MHAFQSELQTWVRSQMINKAVYVFTCLFLVPLEAVAEFDHHYFGRHVLGVPGGDWTPVTIHPPEILGNQKVLLPGESEDLARFFDYPENLASLVLHDNRIVYERYNLERQIDRGFLAPGMSMTKTATGLVIGHLLCSGQIRSLDDPLGNYSTTLAQTAYADVTIKNALQMASGINAPTTDEKPLLRKLMNRGYEGQNDQREALLALDGSTVNQGKVSVYHSLDSIALGILVAEVTDVSLSQVFYEEIYSNIGADNVMSWWMDRRGNSLAFGGLRMTPRDWARLGQYMIDQIRQDSCLGQFVLDGIESSISSTTRDDFEYGYLFWVTDVSGKRMAVLHGYAGQVMVLNHRDNRLALVISASSDYKYGDKHIATEILPAVIIASD